MQYKCFFKVSKQYRGHIVFTLYRVRADGASVEYRPFTLFVESMIDSSYARATVEMYSTSLANFIDYVYCIVNVESVDLSEIKLVYRAYHGLLVDGEDSYDPNLRKFALEKARRPIQSQSSATYHAGIDSWLRFCAQLCADRDQYMAAGVEVERLDDEGLIFLFGMINPKTLRDRKRIISSDYGVKEFANNRIATHIPSDRRGDVQIERNKYFPLGHILELLRNARSPRERALHALLAASSIRTSEAMQILREDIDFTQRKIYIVNPWGRENFNSAYRGLSYFEKKKFAWKGRATKHTFLLEPYSSIFFESLELLFDKKNNSGHNFIFSTRDGKPLFLADYSRVIVDPFKRAAQPIYDKLGLSMQNVGPHSLRHSFCYFMLNFVRRNGKMGMTPHELIQLTGHANTQSLSPYEQLDLERMFEEIEVANNMFADAEGLSEAEYHVMYLERRLEEWRRMMRKEKESKSEVQVLSHD